MRPFLRETFESIFLAVKVPNKVMSGYVDECIISLIRHTTFKSAISLIVADIKDSRSKGVREHCMVGGSYMCHVSVLLRMEHTNSAHYSLCYSIASYIYIYIQIYLYFLFVIGIYKRDVIMLGYPRERSRALSGCYSHWLRGCLSEVP